MQDKQGALSSCCLSLEREDGAVKWGGGRVWWSVGLLNVKDSGAFPPRAGPPTTPELTWAPWAGLPPDALRGRAADFYRREVSSQANSKTFEMHKHLYI